MHSLYQSDIIKSTYIFIHFRISSYDASHIANGLRFGCNSVEKHSNFLFILNEQRGQIIYPINQCCFTKIFRPYPSTHPLTYHDFASMLVELKL